MNPHEPDLGPHEERWLEDVLAQSRRAPGEAPTGDDGSGSRELGEFLREARATLSSPEEPSWSAVREGALVGRILSQTTREDLSWRGELRLVGAYLGDRMRESGLLRLVAASLILHLAALPVVALWMGRQPERQPIQIGLELPLEDANPEPPTDAGLEAQEPGDLKSPAAFDNARRRARFVLSQLQGPPLPVPAPGDSLERKLLHGRSAFLRDRSWEPWWNESNLWSSASDLAQVLWLELLLDAYVLEGRHSTEMGLFLVQLEASFEADAPRHGLAFLQHGVLERAWAYGLRSAPEGFDPALVPEPFLPTWLDHLKVAAMPHSLDAWLDAAALGAWIRR